MPIKINPVRSIPFFTCLWILSSLFGTERTKMYLAEETPDSSNAQKIGIYNSTPKIAAAVRRTYYVSATGNDSNTGLSESTPFKTIQKAADLSNPGDTVLIMNGVYKNGYDSQVVSITRSGTANAWITFKAYPGHYPKLKHNGWHGILIKDGASYIEVNGLEIVGNNANITLDYAKNQQKNPYNPLTNGNCLSIDGRDDGHPHHIRILKNKIHGCGGGGIAVIQADYVTIDGNEVFNNSYYSVYANSGISMWQNWRFDNSQGYKMFVTNNKVYGNRQFIPWIATGTITDGNGIIIDDSQNTQNNSKLGAYTGRTLVANNITFRNGGTGIHTYASDRVDIINNTAYLNNRSPEINQGQIIANSSSDVRIFNNILYAIPGKRINSNWNNTKVIYDYNIYANSSAIDVKGPHDIVADPKLIDPSIFDFRLQGISPAIDNGYTWTIVKFDFAGKPRPSGIGYDRGAYEY
ncbi:right-handed parallel beta-helix repeat-containing protein [Merismopedia glauca]|uniref:right-handed parallel beta-helix repeat-containing protein n=1 Tax=Merismopedia glauca TaxID=292586 RepID=UPI001C639853|nr:right-handed parallel beta-helix repeat-containing protein [Merismopedia glauca]